METFSYKSEDFHLIYYDKHEDNNIINKIEYIFKKTQIQLEAYKYN